jgi:roadblock/LC7 domain-containing protein
MNEFDELVSRDGVLMAGRLGPDWRVAEHKSARLYTENPQAEEIMHWFFQAATMMFQAMAVTTEGTMIGGNFNPTSMLPVKGWTFFGGDYTIWLRVNRFAVAETAKVKSIDEVVRLLDEAGKK